MEGFHASSAGNCCCGAWPSASPPPQLELSKFNLDTIQQKHGVHAAWVQQHLQWQQLQQETAAQPPDQQENNCQQQHTCAAAAAAKLDKYVPNADEMMTGMQQQFIVCQQQCPSWRGCCSLARWDPGGLLHAAVVGVVFGVVPLTDSCPTPPLSCNAASQPVHSRRDL